MSETVLATPGASTSAESVPEPERPQADPLPSKRGEIGFVEGVHSTTEATHSTASLPSRHPADREPDATTSTTRAAASTPVESNDPSTPTPESTSAEKKAGLLGFLKPISWGGLRLTTLLKFGAQTLLLAATVVAWVFTSKLVTAMAQAPQVPAGLSVGALAHVVFIVAMIVELVFLERRVFRLRGERYSYLHPGEILPRHRSARIAGAPGIPFAPWNRPPLPTYAAALAQSGHGTGDVEDHIIAAPPPPAYGNTRGSTFLLSGYMSETLQAQRPPSIRSTVSIAPPDRPSRPVSYRSRDEEWEIVAVAERSQRLEETLERLERTDGPAVSEAGAHGSRHP